VNYVINEQAARAMGMNDPLGQRLTFWGQEGEIVGVVKDFHMASLYSDIEPTIIRFDPEQAEMLFVRTEAGKTQEALAGLEAAYTAFNPDYPFTYRFLDENYEQTYRSEIVIGKLANYFALLAVFIACLGLFGLASYTAEQRAKEIGIRKVLGASVPGVVALLSQEFARLVLVAWILAVPLGYLAASRWLEDFAYRIEISWRIFLMVGSLALAIALLTVSYQAIRAALGDPVKALRYE
jgi:ABC-type antimicrobial peptide transport system permease subunit